MGYASTIGGVILFLLAGCTAKDPETAACSTLEEYFVQGVYSDVLLPQCLGCHHAAGFASHTRMVLRAGTDAETIQNNLEVLRSVAAIKVEQRRLVLLKPTGALNHGGGEQIEEGSDAYEVLSDFVTALDAAPRCYPEVAR